MNNITKIDTNVFEETDGTKKITLKGKVDYLSVYRIPLDFLYYNDQNGRIATWINKHNVEHSDISKLDKAEYNNIIEQYIIDSNKAAFNKTKKNIEALTQREPGVVLSDGRIIDGNRRFSCLRQLYRETGNSKFNYFEAIILKDDVDDKEIKLLELELQHGQDEKIDYNPIDRLVEIYLTLDKKKTIDIKEYASRTNEKESEIRKKLDRAKIMVDFLEYINAPEQFYIARDMELDGPINDICNIKRTITDQDLWEKAQSILFENMLIKPQGDITRMIRSIGDIIKSDYFDEYFAANQECSDEINVLLKNTDRVDTAYIREMVRNNSELKEKMVQNFQEFDIRNKKDISKKRPVDLMRDLLRDIEKIDKIAVSRMNNDFQKEFFDYAKKLKQHLEEILELNYEFKAS